LTVQQQPLPPFTPLWGRQHPWIWSAVQGVGAGVTLGGMMRFEGQTSIAAAWAVGGIMGVFGLIVGRILIDRPPWEPAWSRNIPFLNPRTMPRWTALSLPLVGLSILASHVSSGAIERRVWEIVWAVVVALLMGWLGYLQWRHFEEIRRVTAPLPLDPHAPPQPPPAGVWPGIHEQIMPSMAPATSGMATPLRRLGARAIDVFILFFVAGGIAEGVAGTKSEDEFGNALLIAFLGVWTVSEIVLIALRGQTLGKMIVGIRVARNDEGQPPGLGRAFMRWFAMAALYVTIVLGPIASAWMLWDKQRQTLYDKAAGTIVLRAQKPVRAVGFTELTP
jgi:uncharacterized RDD family membrane protein YckC